MNKNALMSDNVLKNEEENLIGANIVKTILFSVFAFLIVIGTFFFESRAESSVIVVQNSDFVMNYEEGTEILNNGFLNFSADAETSKMELIYNDGLDYVFDFNVGRVWGNFLISDANVNIVVGSVVLIPNHASFDLDFKNSKLNISVYEGDVYLGFLDEGVEVSEYIDEYSSLFMNTLLVPRDSKVEISLSQIDERLKYLLYSKLVKEFRYSAIPSVERSSDWVVSNINKQKKYIETVGQKIRSNIIRNGLNLNESSMSNLVFWVEEKFTFVPIKKENYIFERLFSYLNDAIFYASSGDPSLSVNSLSKFNLYFDSISDELKSSDRYNNEMNSYIFELLSLSSADGVYPVLEDLLNKKFELGTDLYFVLNSFWLDIYSSLDSGGASFRSSFDRYYKYLNSFMSSHKDYDNYELYISYQNQLFDNLFLRYSEPYYDEYFAVKKILEDELLGFYDEGQLKDELKQAFIDNKIKFLKRLKVFFFDDELSVERGKDIISRLVDEVNKLMPENSSNVAVIQLFESELKDIGDFWGYLNSSEYNSSEIYGATHDERYKVYLNERDKIWSFINIQEDVLGEDFVADISISDLKAELEAILSGNSDISDVVLGKITDVDQRYIDFTAVLGGYPFSAIYDRYYDSLKSVYSYETLITERSIKLNNLLPLLKNEFADLLEPVDDSPVSDLTLETNAERVARNYIVRQIEGAGFIISVDDVKVADSDAAVYRVTKIYLDYYPEVLLTFDYSSGAELGVTNLFMVLNGKPVLLKDSYTLDELKDLVVAEAAFSSGVVPESIPIVR